MVFSCQQRNLKHHRFDDDDHPDNSESKLESFEVYFYEYSQMGGQFWPKLFAKVKKEFHFEAEMRRRVR